MTEHLNEVVPHRNISNSEVIAFLSCRQMYDFAYMRNLAPKKTPIPLARGTLGHLAFEVYIKARLDGSTHDLSMRAAHEMFANSMGEISLEIVMETRFLFDRYMNYHKGWPEWDLLGTEEALTLPIADGFTIPMRYDLMVREKSSGKILVGDFKYTFRFWSQNDHALNPQMPKYITIMRANGMRVDGGFLEEIRTEKLSEKSAQDIKKLWKRTPYYPSPAKSRNTMKQHIATSIEIMNYRAMTPENREDATIPILSKHGPCKFCSFADLCASKMDGGDVELFIETDFVQNTYGYNFTEEVII